VADRPVRSLWLGLLHKGDDIIPIPATKRRKYLEENVAAATVRLDSKQMKELDDALPRSFRVPLRFR
jgi:aryl-alcohol dehydrogenase-like predicted oxidoreductase